MAYPIANTEIYFNYDKPGLLLEDCRLYVVVYADGDIKATSVSAPRCEDTNLLTSDDELFRALGERIRDAALADDDFREDVYEATLGDDDELRLKVWREAA